MYIKEKIFKSLLLKTIKSEKLKFVWRHSQVVKIKFARFMVSGGRVGHRKGKNFYIPVGTFRDNLLKTSQKQVGQKSLNLCGSIRRFKFIQIMIPRGKLGPQGVGVLNF